MIRAAKNSLCRHARLCIIYRSPILVSLYPGSTTNMKKAAALFGLIFGLAFAANAQRVENTDAADAAAAASKVYEVLQKQDWAGLFQLVSFSPALQKQMPNDPNEFARQFVSGLNESAEDAAKTKALFDGMSDIQVGTAVVTGNKAAVPASCRITIGGNSLVFKGTANMIKIGNAWRWDMTSSDDPAVATETALSALLGMPMN